MTDIAIIGAGPAGIAAAVTAAQHGAQVALIDEQPSAGGQIYRKAAEASPGLRQVLGPDCQKGAALIGQLQGLEGLTHIPGAELWHIEPGGRVTYSQAAESHSLRARHVILATGAIERPVPVKGWTLPGVLTAGAAQILLKGNGLVARDGVLVGSGPLLYLLAVQMVDAGRPPKALVETQSTRDLIAAAAHLPGGLLGGLPGWRQLGKGIGLLSRLRKAGVRRYVGASGVEVLGKERAEGVAFLRRGKRVEIAAEHVFLHQGVIPNTQISRALGLRHIYDSAQRCFRPVLDPRGQSEAEAISIAGDGARIEGGDVAWLSGQITALAALEKLGMLDRDTCGRLIEPLEKAKARDSALRPFLDRAYCPPDWLFAPEDQTLVCRCEEVTAGELRQFAKLGCKGPNQAKAFGRAGMGPCQGRICGPMISEILARETGQSLEDTGQLRVRTPLKPVALGEVARLKVTK